MRINGLFLVLLLVGCRIERVSSGSEPAPSNAPVQQELWVYTSMYRQVIDALEPTLKTQLPGVTIHWFQAGSEKVTAKLEAELAAGGSPCDVLITSDPFLYQHYKEEGRWDRYVSPNGLRTPSRFVDPDGHFAAIRLSTMVLAFRKGEPAPTSFDELANVRWKGAVALGDPLTSGTAFTWAVTLEDRLGPDYFTALRTNEARVAGGNAAVIQKLEGKEASVGVVLLENVLAARAKGSPLDFVWPKDGAVIVPGYAGILKTTAHREAARAFVDALHSLEAQQVIAQQGAMHAVDPRVGPPAETISLSELLDVSATWGEPLMQRGLHDGDRVKRAFSGAFAQ